MSTTNRPVKASCPKCSGGRRIRAFMHVENGVCFLCNGAGTVDISATARTAKPVTRTQDEKDSYAKMLVRTAANALRDGEEWGNDEDGFNRPAQYRKFIGEASAEARTACNKALKSLIARGLRVVETADCYNASADRFAKAVA